MQILNNCSYGEDMDCSISLTGVTILKQGTYKSRHGGLKEIIEKPIEGFMLAKNDTLELERLANIKKPRKKIPPITTPAIKSKRSTQSYKINKKEISHRIRNFVNQMPGKKCLYFWTVTFPLATSDDTAFILLNKWLTRLRKEKMLKSYLWISERQKNSTIHFHIALHKVMCVKKANRYMRACIFTCIDNKEINYSRVEAIKYNGVDISKSRKTKRVTNFAQKKNEKNLVNYITKYISKNDESFTHLAWHSSRDYSNLVINIRCTMKEFANGKLGLHKQDAILFESAWYVFYPWLKGPPQSLLDYLAFANQTIISLLNLN